MIKGKFGDKLELHKGWMSVPKYTEINGKISIKEYLIKKK